MKDKSLNLFFGREPSEDFLDDLESLKKLSEKEVFELIDKIVEWYPKENVDKEWEEWIKHFTKEQEKEKKQAIRALIFIFKEFASGNINELELKEDFEILELSKYLDNFIRKMEPFEKEFRKEALTNKKPYENVLVNIDWRIDTKHYRDGTEEKIAFIEFVYSSVGEKKVTQFDLTKRALKHLIYRLNKIEEEL